MRFFPIGHFPQSSSASRLTAGAVGFLNLSQSVVRPDRYGEPSRFDTMPSSPVRHQRSLDRTGGLNKVEFLAHRNFIGAKMIARRESGRSALVERPEEWLNSNGIVAKTYETASHCVGKPSRR